MNALKKWIVPIVLGILILFGIGSYNGLVGKEENAKTAWSNVESAYQRRNDLIGNLVKTVQGAADFEKSTLEAVVNARAKATDVTIDPSNINPDQLAKFQQAQSGLKGSLDRLLLVVEKYPDLKANQNFLELQSQLEGTENRINVARDRFNESVNVYNKSTKTFPSVLFAKIFGFNEMARFKAEEGAEKAPEVNFDFNSKK
ncbi:MAG: LemA family protein [Flavobacterium sp.]|jgi:LemA protein|uniref:LemA family protein n=2 Tax=Flavobacterium sp. TaxID=239 RepID=UPI0022BF9649|nr:LemA family protein [Flavobacterium sp.]MCZ8169029.1 LemA family protein [Flavobacterium sp.]MCZ8297205.1 LemA family protein [Flavobacterium sp.]